MSCVPSGAKHSGQFEGFFISSRYQRITKNLGRREFSWGKSMESLSFTGQLPIFAGQIPDLQKNEAFPARDTASTAAGSPMIWWELNFRKHGELRIIQKKKHDKIPKTFESKPENLGLVLDLFILEGPQKEGNASSKDVVAGLSIPSFHSSDN